MADRDLSLRGAALRAAAERLSPTAIARRLGIARSGAHGFPPGLGAAPVSGDPGAQG